MSQLVQSSCRDVYPNARNADDMFGRAPHVGNAPLDIETATRCMNEIVERLGQCLECADDSVICRYRDCVGHGVASLLRVSIVKLYALNTKET